MTAPVAGARAVGAVAWGKHHDPPQGAGWITPTGKFIPAKVRDDRP
jgi:hypothetical protein